MDTPDLPPAATLRAVFARDPAAPSGARFVRYECVEAAPSVRALCEGDVLAQRDAPTRLLERGVALRLAPAFEPTGAVGRAAPIARAAPITSDLDAIARGRLPRARLAEALAVVLDQPVERVRPLLDERGVWGWQAASGTLTWKRRAGARPAETLREGPNAARATGEAWELMAARGLIPTSWVGDPDRRFVAARQRDDEARGRGRAQAVPPTLRDVVAYASDADAMATAEALAREAATRLAPWSGCTPTAIWWAAANSPELGFDDARVVPEALTWLARVPLEKAAARRRTEFQKAYNRGYSDQEVSCATGWQALVDRDARVPGSTREMRALLDAPPSVSIEERLPPATLRGRRFAELGDPFEPLLGIRALGVRTWAVVRASIRLAMPPL